MLLTAACTAASAQGLIETDYLTASDMNDKAGANHGSGDMLRVKGRYTLPLSVKMNERRQPTAWSLTLAASHAWTDCKGEAETIIPDKILNASLNVSHTRPLSERWTLIASLGAGVYSAPDEVAWRSVLANGAAIFAYKFTDNLSAGFGLGLTNSYGAPMVLPMGYLRWQTSGNVKVSVNMANSMSIKGSTMFGKVFGLELTAIEMDGMSAVRRIDGETKIFSMTMMRSSICPTFHIAKKTTLRLGIGGTWLRSVRTSDRSLKGFFSTFGSDDGKYNFHPSLRFNVGLSYGL